MSRNTHSRQNDHHDTDLDTNIALAAVLDDRYAAGTTLQDVLASLIARVHALEIFVGVYSVDLHAIVLRTQTGSFTEDAVVGKEGSGSFKADALLQ